MSTSGPWSPAAKSDQHAPPFSRLSGPPVLPPGLRGQRIGAAGAQGLTASPPGACHHLPVHLGERLECLFRIPLARQCCWWRAFSWAEALQTRPPSLLASLLLVQWARVLGVARRLRVLPLGPMGYVQGRSALLLMQELRHNRILPVLGALWSWDGSAVMIAREPITAMSVQELLSSPTPFDIETRTTFVQDILSAMAYLEGSTKVPGYIRWGHLNIGNLWLDEYFSVKLGMDLGDQLVSQGTQSLTTAPEVLRGQPHTSTSDVYSFGLVRARGYLGPGGVDRLLGLRLIFPCSSLFSDRQVHPGPDTLL